MANQPTKIVTFYGVDAGRLGLCQDADGNVVGVDCAGFEVASVEVTPVTNAGLGLWQGRIRQSNFPGGGFEFAAGGDALSDGTRGVAGLSVTTPNLVLHATAVQAGAAFDVTFTLTTKSE
jgi:hypothetical protein